MLHAHNMQTCMGNVPNPCMLHAKNMPVTCRDLGRISTRVAILLVLRAGSRYDAKTTQKSCQCSLAHQTSIKKGVWCARHLETMKVNSLRSMCIHQANHTMTACSIHVCFLIPCL